MGELLIIGQTGMLGRAWTSVLDARGRPWRGVSRPVIDLQDRASIEAAITHDTDQVINCAGWTAVNLAEEQEQSASLVNGTAVGWIADRCKAVGACLVHYSSDYVFDGKAQVPYAPEHPRAPINAYGRSKALGEEALEALGADYLLVRTSWVYAPWGQNFVLAIAGAARQQAVIRIVDDQIGCPSSARHVAEISLALLDQDQRGVFHVTDGGACSWYDFGKAVVERVAPACRVEPCSSTERAEPAPRPAYSVLDTTATERLLGRFAGWQHDLDAVMTQVLST